MGTRADFYVGRGEQAEWLGSIAWDGYQIGIPQGILRASSEATYREAVEALIQGREDGTHPRDGWPWPWEDSRLTDYAYAFDAGSVYVSNFGHRWFLATEPEPEDTPESKTAEFPNMKERQAVTFGKRSGVMIFGVKS